MRLAVLGDIHSNYDALETVLRHVATHHPDTILHVGDVVGYCTEFERVIRCLLEHGVRGVCGNHDLMVLGLLDTKRSIGAAQEAVSWTRSRLSPEARAYLQDLPRELILNEVIIFHASPDSIEKNITTVEHAEAAFQSLMARNESWFVAFHGHTHKQRIFELKNDVVRLVHRGEGTFSLDPNAKYLISAGSVGQSRDSNPRTGYVLYDSNHTVSFLRVPYDWQSCKSKLRTAGLGTKLFVSDIPARRPLLRQWIYRLYLLLTKSTFKKPPAGSG